MNQAIDQYVSPWVSGTVDDDGTRLQLDTLEGQDIPVLVEGEGRPRGTLVQIVWLGVGDGTSPTPPYQTAWQRVERDNETMNFIVPLVEANLRTGKVQVGFDTLSPDALWKSSPWRQLEVNTCTTLLSPEIPDADDDGIHLDISRRGIDIKAPRQPDLMPPASRVTFFWESSDSADDRCRGWDETYASADLPATGMIPLAALLRLQGRSLHLKYAVDIYASEGLLLKRIESSWRSFPVLGGSAFMPTPDIPGAMAGVIRKTDFEHELPLHIPPWPGIAAGQMVWASLSGPVDEGDATVTIADGIEVTSPMLATGFTTAIPLSALPSWRDGGVLKLSCHVDLTGTGKTDAATFPERIYTFVADTVGLGRAVEFETFDGLTSLRPGASLRLRFMNVVQEAGQLTLATAASTDAPYFTGSFASIAAASGAKTRLSLDRPAVRVRLAVGPDSTAFPAQIKAYDRFDNVIIDKHVEKISQVRLEDAEQGRFIAAIELSTSGNRAAKFDNLICETGLPWRDITERTVETFNDLPPGEHGETFEFERWSISAPGGDIAVIVDPETSRGACLSIRMTPEGRTHYLTPRAGVRPRSRISMRMRSTGMSAHTATVELTYINTIDLTVRTVSKQLNIGPAATVVAFEGNTLPKDTEYLSHLRVIHNTGNTLVAVMYDDIGFE